MSKLLFAGVMLASLGASGAPNPVSHKPQLEVRGKTMPLEEHWVQGKFTIPLEIHWFRPEVFTDVIAKDYAVCFSVPSRGIVYCYKEVVL